MVNLGVVGERDSVMGFKALGLYVVEASSPTQAASAVDKMAREGFVVIFITETMATQMGETIDKYKAEAYPAIIPIPGNQGTTGLGMQLLKSNVEKAVGADILFGKEG